MRGQPGRRAGVEHAEAAAEGELEQLLRTLRFDLVTEDRREELDVHGHASIIYSPGALGRDEVPEVTSWGTLSPDIEPVGNMLEAPGDPGRSPDAAPPDQRDSLAGWKVVDHVA